MISGRVVGLSPRPLAPTVGLDPVLQLGGSGLEQRASRVPGAGGKTFRPASSSAQAPRPICTVPSASGPSSELAPTLPPTPLLGAPSSSFLPPWSEPFSTFADPTAGSFQEVRHMFSHLPHPITCMGDRLSRRWSLGSQQ